MSGKRIPIIISLAGCLLVTAACSIFSPESSGVRRHPETMATGRPVCNTCHDEETRLKGALKTYGAFDHTATFVSDHRLAAGRDEQTCAICHGTSFCTDCHANRIEIKPSTRYGNRPDRELIHRGDFLTRHRIEGKVDPTGCYRCHGRANNEKCQSCHR